jgi:hypothetical protein
MAMRLQLAAHVMRSNAGLHADQAARRVQAGEAIAAIAATHERKIGAITARLVRLGLITEHGVVQPG